MLPAGSRDRERTVDRSRCRRPQRISAHSRSGPVTSLARRTGVLGFLRRAELQIGADVHMIFARRAHRRSFKAAERPNVADELPHLLVRQLALEARHAVGTSFDDGGEYLRRITSVDPLVVHERRTNTAAALEVTSRAVHLIEESLAFCERVRVVAVGRFRALRDYCRSGLQFTAADCSDGRAGGRHFPEFAFLILATSQ